MFFSLFLFFFAHKHFGSLLDQVHLRFCAYCLDEGSLILVYDFLSSFGIYHMLCILFWYLKENFGTATVGYAAVLQAHLFQGRL